MTLELSAEVLDGQNRLLSRVEHACRVQWLVWDEVYEIETSTNGRRSVRTALTSSGVIRACLTLGSQLTTNAHNVSAMRLVIRLAVNRNQSPSGWFGALSRLVPAKGAPLYSDVADTGMLTVCGAPASSSPKISSSSGTP